MQQAAHIFQSNGEAERAVQTIKNLMRTKDLHASCYFAHLRNYTYKTGYSTAGLLMSH